MNYKLHIDISKGLIEAEGDKDFVMHVYEDFKDSVAKAKTLAQEVPLFTPQQDGVGKLAAPEKDKNDPIQNNSKKKAKVSKSSQPSLNKNLNIYEENGKPSLANFLKKYKASSSNAYNLLFVYYLREIKGIEQVGINEIYTCYKHTDGVKIPTNIKQSLWNCAHKGWLDTSSTENVTITIAGENAVSHELIVKETEAA